MAVVPDGVGKIVYVVENGKAKRVSVELGKRLPGKVEIVKGLTPDMQIITRRPDAPARRRDGRDQEAPNGADQRAAAPVSVLQ
jgi:multidrug efflux pump subunit AcrA (membrane-fusion protein)